MPVAACDVGRGGLDTAVACDRACPGPPGRRLVRAFEAVRWAVGALTPPGKAGKTGKPAWCRPDSRWGALPFECGSPPLAA
jgi:hypothetical protein